MPLVDSLRKTLFKARAIPGRLGLRTHTVELLTATYSGTHPGEGTLTDEAEPIVQAGNQPVRVHWLNDERCAVKGLQSGSVDVGPITPLHSTGGTDLAGLQGLTLGQGVSRYLRITGPNHPNGALYRIKAVTAEKALQYRISAEPASYA